MAAAEVSGYQVEIDNNVLSFHLIDNADMSLNGMKHADRVFLFLFERLLQGSEKYRGISIPYRDHRYFGFCRS